MFALAVVSLNPCFNGRYSLRVLTVRDEDSAAGLNPCFNGRYSLSVIRRGNKGEPQWVLILVLMEDTH